MEAAASPAEPPPMVSVIASWSSRADLRGGPKFGPFLKPKFNSGFDRNLIRILTVFWGETFSLVQCMSLSTRSIREKYVGRESGPACEPSSLGEEDPCRRCPSREMYQGWDGCLGILSVCVTMSGLGRHRSGGGVRPFQSRCDYSTM